MLCQPVLDDLLADRLSEPVRRRTDARDLRERAADGPHPGAGRERGLHDRSDPHAVERADLLLFLRDALRAPDLYSGKGGVPPHVESNANPRSTHFPLTSHSSDMLPAHWIVWQACPSVAAVRHWDGLLRLSQ